jgi:hypothetical protein
MAVSRSSSSSSAARRPAPRSTSTSKPSSTSTAKKSNASAQPKKVDQAQKPQQSRQADAQRLEQQKAVERVQVDQQTQADTRQRVAAEDSRAREQVAGATGNATNVKRGLSPDAVTSANDAPKTGERPTTTAQANQKLAANDDPLRSTDAATREKAMSDVQARAAQGDRQAIDQLQGVLDQSPYKMRDEAGLERGDAEKIRSGAMIGLEGAKDHLTAQDHQKIGERISEIGGDIGDRSAKLLGEQAQANKPGATDALRDASNASSSINRDKATGELAKLDPSQLQAGDYKNFARDAGSYGPGKAAREALVDGVKNDRAGAMDAVREKLNTQGDGYFDQKARTEAANVINDAGTANLNQGDVDQLKSMATGDSEASSREAGFKALASAGTGTPPNQAAFDAAREVQKNIPPRPEGDGAYSRDENDGLRRASREFTQKAWANPQTQEAVAGEVVANARSGKDAAQAAEMLREKAMSGDVDAIRSLSQGTARGSRDAGADKAREVLGAAAANGQAEKTTQALLDQANAPGSSDQRANRGDTYAALGESAAHLDANDPKMDQVRSTLREGAGIKKDRSSFPTRSNEGAAEGMRAIGDRLKGEDLNALANNLTQEGVKTIQEAGPNLSADEARPVIDNLMDKATGDKWNSEMRASKEVQAMKGLAGQMNAGDVQKLGDLNAKRTLVGGIRETQAQKAQRHKNYHGAINDTLSEVLTQNKSPEVQKKAADAMLKSRAGTIDGKARDNLVNYAAGTDNAQLKGQVLDRLPKGPLTNEKLSQVADNYTRSLSSAIARAPEGSQMHKLGQLYQMQGLANSKEYGRNVNTALVNSKINELSGKQPLKGQLEGMRKSAVQRAIGGDPVQKQKDYILSDTFQQRMKLEGTERATNSVQQELGKLGMMDSKAVEDTKNKLQQKTIHENSVKLFQSQDRQTTEQAVNSGLTALAATPGISKKTAGLINSLSKADQAKVAQHISDALHDVNANSLQAAADGALRTLNAGRRLEQGAQHSTKAKAFQIVSELTKNGRFGTAVSAFGVASIAMGDKPQTPKEWAATSATAMSAMGNATDVGKLLNVGNLRKFGEGVSDFGKLTKVGQALKVMDFAGPVADVVSGGLDVHNAVQEFNRGDVVGGTAAAVGAGASFASAAAGLAIVAGATGPAAPAVLLGGAIVGLGAWGVNHFFGESNEESFLKRGYRDRSGRPIDFWIER